MLLMNGFQRNQLSETNANLKHHPGEGFGVNAWMRQVMVEFTIHA